MASSRLVQYERKQALKSAFIYVVLTAIVLFAITRFGTAVVTSVTGIFGRDVSTNTTIDSTLIAPPQVEVLPDITNQPSITVHGTAAEGSTVRITLNGQKQDIISNAQGNWNIEFALHDGENMLRAQVVDSSGNTSREVSKTIVLDTTKPTLEISSPEEGSTKSGKKEQTIQVSGKTEPEASVKVNDRVAIVNANGEFNLTVSLNDGDNEFTITATDRAGNVMQETRKVTFSQ